MERRKPAQEPEQTEQRRKILPLIKRQTGNAPTFANATALDIISTGMSTADTSSAEALTRSAQNAQTRADASLVESQQYNATLTHGGGLTREAPAGAPVPSREPQHDKHGRRALIGIAGVAAAAATVFGGIKIGTSLFSSESGNDSGVNLTVPTPDNTPTGIGIVVKETPTAEHTVAATPSPEKVDLKIFKPNAIRETYGKAILALDENYPDTKRCDIALDKNACPAVVNKLSLNPDMPKEEAENRLADFTDQIKFVAWEKLSQGLTDNQLMANYDNLYKEYKTKTANGEVLKFTIPSAFTDESDYRVSGPAEASSNDKVEYMYVANRPDQAVITTSSTQYIGILRNSKTETITLVIYDTTAGGVNQPGYRPQYGAATSIDLAGIILGDKALQETKKLSDHTDRLSSLALKLRATIAPNVTNEILRGAVTTQK